MTVAIKVHDYFGEPGGEPHDSVTFTVGKLRAEMTTIVSQFNLSQASKIVDAILTKYDLKEKSV